MSEQLLASIRGDVLAKKGEAQRFAAPEPSNFHVDVDDPKPRGGFCTSERLSDLYGIEVDVIKVRDRYLVVSAEDELPTEPGGHAHHGHAH